MSDNLIDLNAQLTVLMGCEGATVMDILFPKFIRKNLKHVVFICDGRIVCDCNSRKSSLISSWRYVLSVIGVRFTDFSIIKGVLILVFETIPY